MECLSILPIGLGLVYVFYVYHTVNYSDPIYTFLFPGWFASLGLSFLQLVKCFCCVFVHPKNVMLRSHEEPRSSGEQGVAPQGFAMHAFIATHFLLGDMMSVFF